jgi:hypothetical protein
VGYRDAPDGHLGSFRSVHAAAPPGVLAAALAWMVALFVTRKPDKERVQRVDLHEGGLKFWREEIVESVVWRDVEEVHADTADVWFGSTLARPVPVTAPLRLKCHDGARHELSPRLAGATELFAVVIARCSRGLLTECRASLAEGGALTFGPVSLTNVELCVREKRLPLAELVMVSMRPDHLVFARKGADRPWASVRYDELPHVALLVALLPARALPANVW